MQTLYVVPAATDQAGQCRIVAASGSINSPREDYRNRPDLWREGGLMNSSGRLVCLDAPREVFAEIQSCEPLMAGLSFRIDVLPG